MLGLVHLRICFPDPYPLSPSHAQIKAEGVGRLVILPLYPQFSISTSGSSFRLLEGLLKTDVDLFNLKHTVIPSW